MQPAMERLDRNETRTVVATPGPQRQRAPLHGLAVMSALALACASGLAGAITVTSMADLRFGMITNGSNSGTVTIATDGGRTCTGGIACLSSGTGGAARFEVSADPQTNYTIMLPASTTLTDGNSHSMTVDGFADSHGGIGMTDATGTDTFSVGASLQVGAGQVPGSYQGSFDVMVEYQ